LCETLLAQIDKPDTRMGESSRERDLVDLIRRDLPEKQQKTGEELGRLQKCVNGGLEFCEEHKDDY
jgi:hypothetical protein